MPVRPAGKANKAKGAEAGGPSHGRTAAPQRDALFALAFLTGNSALWCRTGHETRFGRPSREGIQLAVGAGMAQFIAPTVGSEEGRLTLLSWHGCCFFGATIRG
jgi:hypothetical protein